KVVYLKEAVVGQCAAAVEVAVTHLEAAMIIQGRTGIYGGIARRRYHDTTVVESRSVVQGKRSIKGGCSIPAVGKRTGAVEVGRTVKGKAVVIDKGTTITEIDVAGHQGAVIHQR